VFRILRLIVWFDNIYWHIVGGAMFKQLETGIRSYPKIFIVI